MTTKNADYLETSGIIDRDSGVFGRMFKCLCPCFTKRRDKTYLEDKSKLTMNAGSTQSNELQDMPKIITDNIKTKRSKQMYRSALHSAPTNNEVTDYLEGRRTIPTQIQTYPILNLREKQTLLLSQHPSFKMLARVTSCRLHPKKHLVEKLRLASNQTKGLFSNPKLDAFWTKRYLLFEKFDQGVRLDEDSWAQILPEAVGEHLAMRGQSDVLLDAYCGVGSAAIKFANTCNTVLAADSNILKLECLHNNARIYSADNIIKVNEDFLNLKSTKASTVFLYPQCRPDFTPTTQMDPFTYFKPQLRLLIQKSVSLAPNLVLLLRPNVDIDKLGQLFSQILGNFKNSLCSVQIQKIFFMDKLKYVAVYYGPQVNRQFSLADELEEVYKLLNENKGASFHHVRVVKEVREKFGMAMLLQLACEAKHSFKGETINLFYDVIRKKRLIPDGRLENIIAQQKMEPGKILTSARPSLAEEASDHTKSYTSTNSMNSVDLIFDAMRETRLSNVYRIEDK